MEMNPRYNVCPTQALLLARNAEWGGREMVSLYWGLIPLWAKDKHTGYSMINARAETVFDKPSFRHAVRHRRALIAADGYYEWRSDGKRKQPFYIHRRDGLPLAFAGIWERWAPTGQASIDSCAIIVGPSNDTLRPIHDRQPIIIDPADYDVWMDPVVVDPSVLSPLLRPCSEELLEAYPVSPRVNSPKNDDADLIVPSQI